MPTFIYNGVSKDQREYMVEKYMKSIRPQDPRGKKPLFFIDQKDSEDLKEKKRERKKKWFADRKSAYVKTVEALDAGKEMTDSRGKVHTFVKGKSVSLPEPNSLVPKIRGMMSNPRDPFCQWSEVEEKKDEKKPVGKG